LEGFFKPEDRTARALVFGIEVNDFGEADAVVDRAKDEEIAEAGFELVVVASDVGTESAVGSLEDSPFPEVASGFVELDQLGVSFGLFPLASFEVVESLEDPVPRDRAAVENQKRRRDGSVGLFASLDSNQIKEREKEYLPTPGLEPPFPLPIPFESEVEDPLAIEPDFKVGLTFGLVFSKNLLLTDKEVNFFVGGIEVGIEFVVEGGLPEVAL